MTPKYSSNNHSKIDLYKIFILQDAKKLNNFIKMMINELNKKCKNIA
jgi:hypothetical protein